MRFAARIPVRFQEDNLTWLVLEEDKEDTGGVFLYYHKSLQEECEYDSWHENINNAQAEAETQWGVGKDDWSPLS